MKKTLYLFAFVISLAAGPVFAQAHLWEQPGPCNRSCLNGMVDSYIAAMVAHDPGSAPLSDTIRYTENARVLRIGEGLWQDATQAPTTFKVYVPDPVARQIGFMGAMQSKAGPILLALRLKVEDGRITEAEHMIAGVNERGAKNLVTPRKGLVSELPRRKRIPREVMLMIAASYYDAILQSNAEATLFADDCQRRENGMITAGGSEPGFGGRVPQSCYDQMNTRFLSYITGIDLQRVWIADEVTGLVFALSVFRHDFKTKDLQVFDRDGGLIRRHMEYEPFDFPAVHITKIEDYKIHEQEAMGFRMPYMSGNGWNLFERGVGDVLR